MMLYEVTQAAKSIPLQIIMEVCDFSAENTAMGFASLKKILKGKKTT